MLIEGPNEETCFEQGDTFSKDITNSPVQLQAWGGCTRGGAASAVGIGTRIEFYIVRNFDQEMHLEEGREKKIYWTVDDVPNRGYRN